MDKSGSCDSCCVAVDAGVMNFPRQILCDPAKGGVDVLEKLCVAPAEVAAREILSVWVVEEEVKMIVKICLALHCSSTTVSNHAHTPLQVLDHNIGPNAEVCGG